MRISDWSSDVCSSDLACRKIQVIGAKARHFHPEPQPLFAFLRPAFIDAQRSLAAQTILGDGDIGRNGFEEADVFLAEAVGPAPPKGERAEQPLADEKRQADERVEAQDRKSVV